MSITETARRIAIFLGGSCNPTTWRFDIAMPAFKAHGISFYNPQVDDWSPELEAVEAAAKDSAQTLLFVIDSQTSAVASMVEAGIEAGRGRDVVLVILDIEDGTVLKGKDGEPDQVLTGPVLRDLNRGRTYLGAGVARLGARVYDSVDEAVAALVAQYGA